MLCEKVYPLVVAILLTLLAKHSNINYIDSGALVDALNGILTITTLIIGFWGAVFPVVLNAKNDKETVKRVFDVDEKGLYSEYMNSMLFSGISLIVITVSAYFRDSYKDTTYYKYLFYLLIFSFVLFICTTFRCLHITINLVFLSDIKQNRYSTPDKTALTKKLDEELDREKQLNNS